MYKLYFYYDIISACVDEKYNFDTFFCTILNFKTFSRYFQAKNKYDIYIYI